MLKILGDQSKIIQNFIKNSDTVVAQLDQKKNEVARWITETGRTAEISARGATRSPPASRGCRPSSTS